MRVGKLLLALLLLCLGSLGLSVAGPGEAPQSPEQGQAAQRPDPQPVIAFKGNLLTVKARNAPWAAVLQELGHHTGITIHVVGPFAGTLTQEFEDLPLDHGLRRLFRNTNHVFFYTKDATSGGVPETLTRIWLFADEGGTAVGKQAHSPSAPVATVEKRVGFGPLTKTVRKIPREADAEPVDERATEASEQDAEAE